MCGILNLRSAGIWTERRHGHHTLSGSSLPAAHVLGPGGPQLKCKQPVGQFPRPVQKSALPNVQRHCASRGSGASPRRSSGCPVRLVASLYTARLPWNLFPSIATPNNSYLLVANPFPTILLLDNPLRIGCFRLCSPLGCRRNLTGGRDLVLAHSQILGLSRPDTLVREVQATSGGGVGR